MANATEITVVARFFDQLKTKRAFITHYSSWERPQRWLRTEALCKQMSVQFWLLSELLFQSLQVLDFLPSLAS